MINFKIRFFQNVGYFICFHFNSLLLMCSFRNRFERLVRLYRFCKGFCSRTDFALSLISSLIHVIFKELRVESWNFYSNNAIITDLWFIFFVMPRRMKHNHSINIRWLRKKSNPTSISIKLSFSKGPSIYDIRKKSRFWPPLPLSTCVHMGWTPLPTRGRHEIHTALLKWLVQWPTGPKAEIRLYDSNLFKLYF